jgi:hypothetical protein
MAYRGSITSVGEGDMPDYVYYNADIINNTTNDQTNGIANIDPQIRFNETRDTAIIKDASQYYFSIIRFTMDGANRDLPLFIPQIQENTGQTNVNLTEYSMAYTLQGTYTPNGGGGGAQAITVLPVPRYIQYVPETQNLQSAPVPRSLASPNFRGLWSNLNQYKLGDIVALLQTPQQVLFNQRYGSFLADFFQTITPPSWNQNNSYRVGDAVQYAGIFYICQVPQPSGSPSPVVGVAWSLGPPVGGAPPNASPYWVRVSATDGNSQDLTTRYYWVYTYQAWLDNVNRTIYNPADAGAKAGISFAWTCCWGDLYEAIYQALNAANGLDFLQMYPTLGDFAGQNGASAVPGYIPFIPPVMTWDENTTLFSITESSAIFGEKIGNVVVVGTGFTNTQRVRTFYNSNMFGLFANFANTYWNTVSPTAPCPFPGVSAPAGYVNEILTTNKYYQNVLVLQSSVVGAVLSDYPYWVITQDYTSTDSLWSPVGSIVFTSTLLPVKTEATGAPVILGDGNLGFSAPTVQSAFQPIITDISLDTSSGGAADYRKFIYYAPSAEYRLSDFSSSKQDIRNIDIQVYWKNRLDNQLYPINMFNLTNVSIKVMFKHKRTTT